MARITNDLRDFVYHLKQEKLFIESEKKHLQHLNEKVTKTIEKVYHASFVEGEQRRNYNDFVVVKSNSSPPMCCQRSNNLTKLQFIDGYQVLGHNEPLFGSFLSSIRGNPQLCAECLVAGEVINQEMMQSTASIIFSSLYSNCLLVEDEEYALQLLRHLIEIQIIEAESPRKLLHKSSCSFNQVFKAYLDTIPQAKVFLTAALHQPIMQLLMEDELFLEIDPLKAAERFPADERHRRFGEEGTPGYEEALARYRTWTVKKLVKITSRFIDNIKEAISGFPPTLLWLVRSLFEMLVHEKQIDAKTANIICIDLIFDQFLCSAVVTPEPHGITEAPVSHISRFNLIQVAQILQALARNRWESPDPKVQDLYSNFDKEVLSFVMENIMSAPSTDVPPLRKTKLPLIGLTKSTCLIPQLHLASLIQFLIKVLPKLNDKPDIFGELENILRPVEPLLPDLLMKTAAQPTIQPSLGTSPKRNLLSKVKGTRRVHKQSTEPDIEDSLTSSVSLSINSSASQSTEEEDLCLESSNFDYETVLVVLLNGGSFVEAPGFLSEDKVLASIQESKEPSQVRMNIVDVGANSTSDGTIEKRTRFSLSHDEGSIGNTSDNLEAISEAASTHSVASSLDDVEQVDPPDNLSDMVSANVSGRGTPNVSGRDTPSSMVTDGDDGARQSENPNRVRNMTARAKAATADIEEKFGRFEINPIAGGDETVSLVSDTWSTDVLASDSETIADREAIEDREQLLDQHLQELDRMHGGGPSQFRRGESAGETFETISEAWSTDVLASDSERMTELDTDDTQSVARSDDTGRSEAEVELTEAPRPVDSREENLTLKPPRSPVERVHISVEEESQEGAVAIGGILKDSRKVPVMQVSDSERLDRSVGFRPIVPDEESEDLRQVESSGIQTLGKLTLNLSELPNNGIVPVTQPLLLNPCLTGNKQIKTDDIRRSPKQKDRKALSTNGSAEDTSINVSTTSLASSSSSSGSDGPKTGHAPLQACTSAPVPSLASTGAIPKSISFDKTAEKGDKEIDSESKHKKSFFKGFKLPGFKVKRKSMGSFSRSSDEYSGSRTSSDAVVRKSLSEDNRHPIYEESSDDILEKYRKKPGSHHDLPHDISIKNDAKADDDISIDMNNMDQGGYAFHDAKRKLRRVLSNADFSLSSARGAAVSDEAKYNTDIIDWLKLQLAEAQSMHDRPLIAQIRETLRCVHLFDYQTRESLIQSLKDDYQGRAVYVAYLIRCKQGLLNSIAHMEKVYSRISANTDVIACSLVSVCVRLFLEKKDTELSNFIKDFTQLTVPDEKVEMVEAFLSQLYGELERDPMCLSCTGDQLELAQLTLERDVISHIYIHVLYPNGDGDVSRDQVLHEHIEKLSHIVTPSHKDLRIPKVYQYECPWPSAQAELSCLSAFKTAGDKVRCVSRTSQVIMNLLSLSADSSVPAADDFIPVLVFVLIKANPPSLLSTIQYVNLFYEQRLHGEDQYWWTQFCSAIEFIKTMDYNT